MTRITNSNTEFKREYTDAIKKTVVAFANTNDGIIYIGIEDNGTVVGLPDPDDAQLRVSESIRSGVKPDITMFVEYHMEEIEGKHVLRVDVQKGSSSPYYLTGKGIRPEGVYVRQGASSVPASDSAILQMIKQTDGGHYEDHRSTNQELTFTAAEKEFKKRGTTFDDEQQVTLGIRNRDGIYTNLGLLLSDQCRHTIKMAVYEGLENEVFKDRREFEGSLLKQLNDAYEYIDQYNRTRAEYEGLRRVDLRDYPTEAIREALLNSLVHREYALSSSTLISIFEDRIEFVSVGGLVRGITMEDIMLGVSITRNEKLANIFYRLGLIESYGTGIPKILRNYANSNSKPVIASTNNAFKILLPNKNIQRELDACSPTLGNTEEVNTILRMLETQPELSRKEIDAALDVSQSTSTRILKHMVETGLIKIAGKGKNTRYTLA